MTKDIITDGMQLIFFNHGYIYMVTDYMFDAQCKRNITARLINVCFNVSGRAYNVNE